jgi:hypothetical protein
MRCPDSRVYPLNEITVKPYNIRQYLTLKFEMSQDGEKFMTYIEGKSKKKK